MVDYLRPVFVLSKDETYEGGRFRRIDAFEAVDQDNNYEGRVRYEWREGPDQVLSRADEIEDVGQIEPNWFEIEFPVEYEEILDMEDRLRGSGLDVEQGVPDSSLDEKAESNYRAEFYDERGVTQTITRWRGTIPNQKEFQDVFQELEGRAREHIFD